jgi:hypothetical protein
MRPDRRPIFPRLMTLTEALLELFRPEIFTISESTSPGRSLELAENYHWGRSASCIAGIG